MNANKTAFLRLLNDAEAQVYTLNTAQDAVIGREPDCQVVLDSAKYGGVSRRHALIRYQPESLSFEISDLGSSNGTFVNGQRLLNSQVLKSGDRIQLGHSGVVFGFDDPSLPLTAIQREANQPFALPSAPALPADSLPVAPRGKHNLGKMAGMIGIASGVLVVALLITFRTGIPAFLSDRLPANSPASPAPTVSQQPSGLVNPTGTPTASEASPDALVNTQTLTDPNGLFQVELPVGYQTEFRTDGINLSSADGSFQGAITAIRASQQFTADDLIQGFTHQQSNNSNLQNFTIQNTEAIDEGVRIDWVARLLSANADLDAVTHFLQQGNVVVEVDLFSVDRPFSQQDASEANVILRSLRINP
jgi:pSer/pThr/pTyr-binding forkhead associated (FHA) protein